MMTVTDTSCEMRNDGLSNVGTIDREGGREIVRTVLDEVILGQTEETASTGETLRHEQAYSDGELLCLWG